jgi:hypothetical protein
MPAEQQFTDKQLIDLKARGFSNARIARRFGVSDAAVHQRMDKLKLSRIEWKPYMMPPVIMSTEETREAARDNYHFVANLLDRDNLTTLDAIRIARELRQQLEFNARITSKLFMAEVAQDFVGDVLEALNEVDPEMRDRMVESIKLKQMNPQPLGRHQFRAQTEEAYSDPVATASDAGIVPDPPADTDGTGAVNDSTPPQS